MLFPVNMVIIVSLIFVFMMILVIAVTKSGRTIINCK